jgi:hypothetical protein
MAGNSFNAREQLTVGELAYEVFRLDRIDGVARLPYSLKVLLENLLRNEDGALVTTEQVEALRRWEPTAESGTEVQFTPARVLLQDFTGVPCVVDLVAMRDAMADLGGTPAGSTRSSRPSWSSTTRSSPTSSAAPTRSGATPTWSSSATRSGTSCCGGRSSPSTTSSSCHRTPASATR